MQQLVFEHAWDKTIAPQDRQEIIQYFQASAKYIHNGIHISFLREAINYKGEVLVTVLIHNADDNILTIKDTPISYVNNKQEITTNIFDVPCDINGKTSMPWTFIFSQAKARHERAQYIIIANPTEKE